VHWQTKASYYRAMEKFLHDGDGKLTWERIATLAGGNRTTFYRVIGASAAHPLLREYQTDRRGYAADIATRYRRASTVQQLVDETKVWTYWGYRAGWIEQLDRTVDLTRRAAAESLIRVVREWAAGHRDIARFLDCAPPMAAVEDVAVLLGESGSVAVAHDLVAAVIRAGLGPLGGTANGVLKSVTDQLDRHLLPHRGTAPDQVTTLSGAAFDTVRWLDTLHGESRAAAVRSVTSLLEDTLADVRRLN
jgi:hypothetical protein